MLELLGGDARVRVYESFQRLAEPRVARLGAAGPVAFDGRRRERDDVAPGARGRRRVLVRLFRREGLVGGLDLCVVICLASIAVDAAPIVGRP